MSKQRERDSLLVDAVHLKRLIDDLDVGQAVKRLDARHPGKIGDVVKDKAKREQVADLCAHVKSAKTAQEQEGVGFVKTALGGKRPIDSASLDILAEVLGVEPGDLYLKGPVYAKDWDTLLRTAPDLGLLELHPERPPRQDEAARVRTGSAHAAPAHPERHRVDHGFRLRLTEGCARHGGYFVLLHCVTQADEVKVLVPQPLLADNALPPKPHRSSRYLPGVGPEDWFDLSEAELGENRFLLIVTLDPFPPRPLHQYWTQAGRTLNKDEREHLAREIRDLGNAATVSKLSVTVDPKPMECP
jgi:hypothetical protein